MVDVTRHNFEQLRPQIEAELRSASFVALDTEFTCLLSQEKFANQWFDTGAERYSKLRRNLEHTAINQLGIAIYTAEKNSNSYTASVYNIYLGPTCFLSLDNTLLCQASSLAFLAQHGFDFNTWLYSGLPQLSRVQVASVTATLKSINEGTANVTIQHTVLDELRKILEWSDTAAAGELYYTTVDTAIAAPIARVRATAGLDVDSTSVRDSCSATDDTGADVSSEDGHPDSGSWQSVCSDVSFVPALLATLHDTSRDLYAFCDKYGKITVMKTTPFERARLVGKINKEWRELSAGCVDWLTGCSHLVWLIAKLGKPVVLHNGLCDIMLLYKQFFGPLPIPLSKFKHHVCEEFPMLYDTKVLCHYVRKSQKHNEDVWNYLSKSSLGDLTQSLARCQAALFSPTLQIDPNNNKYAGVGLLHEAGYDAYLTGACFLRLTHLYMNLSLPQGLPQRPMEPREHLACLKFLSNRMHVMRAAITELNLRGLDQMACRPPWLIVENILPKIQASTKFSNILKNLSRMNKRKEIDSEQILTEIRLKYSEPASNNSQQFTNRFPSRKILTTPVVGETIDPFDEEFDTDDSVPGSRPSVPLPRPVHGRYLKHFTPDGVTALIAPIASVDVRPWRHNKMLVATATHDAHRLILTGLRVPMLKIYPYSPYRHSWQARGAMWTGVLASGGISAFLFYSCFKTGAQ